MIGTSGPVIPRISWCAARQLLLRNGPTPSAQISGRLAPGEVFSAEVEGDFLRLQAGVENPAGAGC